MKEVWNSRSAHRNHVCAMVHFPLPCTLQEYCMKMLFNFVKFVCKTKLYYSYFNPPIKGETIVPPPGQTIRRIIYAGLFGRVVAMKHNSSSSTEPWQKMHGFEATAWDDVDARQKVVFGHDLAKYFSSFHLNNVSSPPSPRLYDAMSLVSRKSMSISHSWALATWQ